MKHRIMLVLISAILAVGTHAQDMGKIDPAVQKQIAATLKDYYGVKDALVDSNFRRQALRQERWYLRSMPLRRRK